MDRAQISDIETQNGGPPPHSGGRHPNIENKEPWGIPEAAFWLTVQLTEAATMPAV